MSIVAKYEGKCTSCGGVVTPGQKIEWTKGVGSRHVNCGAPSTGAAALTPAAAPGKCAKCGDKCDPKFRTCYRCSGADKKCQTCGHVERRNSRGYPIGDSVFKGECKSCRDERKMGY